MIRTSGSPFAPGICLTDVKTASLTGSDATIPAYISFNWFLKATTFSLVKVTSGKEENKLQDGNKKNNEKTIEAQGKKSTDQDSKKEKSFSKK